MKNILIVGADSFLGCHLIQYFLNRGFNIFALGKNPSTAQPECIWVEDLDELSKIPIDHIFNLVDGSICAKRWTFKRKKQLVSGLVRSTKSLMNWIRENNKNLKTIITTSSTHYYGICPRYKWANTCSENQHPQPFFISKLYQLLENAALRDHPNAKVVRLGIVLDNKSGIFLKLLKPLRNNLVGHIGNGRQPFNWIHIEDVCRAFEYLITIETSTQYFNLVAPENINQKEMVDVSTQHFRKAPIFNPPYWIYKLILGERSDCLINGQHCEPKALTDNYFIFKHTNLKDALENLFPRNNENIIFYYLKKISKKIENIIFHLIIYLFMIINRKPNKSNK
ncbi:DUF1731 domain-containing protein [Pedobacter sp.]|uniref:DUF1731 domain-containing protein n=1 Tax=Pedobacter sp. TaxID=1411316 RepID=UPI003D7F2218